MTRTSARPSAGTLSTTAPPVNPPVAVARVALVGCGKKKLDGKHAASDLYTGPLFKAALAHATRTADEVFIVSALHGLLALDEEVGSYDKPLASTSDSERERWAYRVCLDLRRRLHGRRFEIAIFAGQKYADLIAHCMGVIDRTVAVTTPLAGLSLGYQLRWFRRAAQLRERAHVAR